MTNHYIEHIVRFPYIAYPGITYIEHIVRFPYVAYPGITYTYMKWELINYIHKKDVKKKERKNRKKNMLRFPYHDLHTRVVAIYFKWLWLLYYATECWFSQMFSKECTIC